jgi:hypothetical protein
MTQDPIHDARFTVVSGEQVTVTLRPVQVQNCLTSAAFDGTGLTRTSQSPDVYQFAVSGNVGDSMLFAGSCEFLAGDPVQAHYNVGISGSQGGNFTSAPVFREMPDAAFQLRFTVA